MWNDSTFQVELNGFEERLKAEEQRNFAKVMYIVELKIRHVPRGVATGVCGGVTHPPPPKKKKNTTNSGKLRVVFGC